MSSLSDKSIAVRFIEGIENGTLSSADAYNTIKDKDPLLVYFLLRYLKEKYSSSHPQATTMNERLIELTSTYDDIRKMYKTGEGDILREWFDDSHTVREFSSRPEEFVELIIEKIEG